MAEPGSGDANLNADDALSFQGCTIHDEASNDYGIPPTRIQRVNRDLEIYVSLPSADKRLFVDVQDHVDESECAKTSSVVPNLNVASSSTSSATRKRTLDEVENSTSTCISDVSPLQTPLSSTPNKKLKRTPAFDNVRLRVRVKAPVKSDQKVSSKVHASVDDVHGKKTKQNKVSSKKEPLAITNGQPAIALENAQTASNENALVRVVGDGFRASTEENASKTSTAGNSFKATADRLPIRILGVSAINAPSWLTSEYTLHVHSKTLISDILILLHSRISSKIPVGKCGHFIDSAVPSLTGNGCDKELPLNAIKLYHVKHPVWHAIQDEVDLGEYNPNPSGQVTIDDLPLHHTVAQAGISPASLLTYAVTRKRTARSFVYVYPVKDLLSAKGITSVVVGLILARTWHAYKQDIDPTENDYDKDNNHPRRQIMLWGLERPSDISVKAPSEISVSAPPAVTASAEPVLADDAAATVIEQVAVAPYVTAQTSVAAAQGTGDHADAAQTGADGTAGQGVPNVIVANEGILPVPITGTSAGTSAPATTVIASSSAAGNVAANSPNTTDSVTAQPAAVPAPAPPVPSATSIETGSPGSILRVVLDLVAEVCENPTPVDIELEVRRELHELRAERREQKKLRRRTRRERRAAARRRGPAAGDTAEQPVASTSTSAVAAATDGQANTSTDSVAGQHDSGFLSATGMPLLVVRDVPADEDNASVTSEASNADSVNTASSYFNSDYERDDLYDDMGCPSDEDDDCLEINPCTKQLVMRQSVIVRTKYLHAYDAEAKRKKKTPSAGAPGDPNDATTERTSTVEAGQAGIEDSATHIAADPETQSADAAASAAAEPAAAADTNTAMSQEAAEEDSDDVGQDATDRLSPREAAARAAEARSHAAASAVSTLEGNGSVTAENNEDAVTTSSAAVETAGDEADTIDVDAANPTNQAMDTTMAAATGQNADDMEGETSTGDEAHTTKGNGRLRKKLIRLRNKGVPPPISIEAEEPKVPYIKTVLDEMLESLGVTREARIAFIEDLTTAALRYSHIAIQLLPQDAFRDISRLTVDGCSHAYKNRQILLIWRGIWPGELETWSKLARKPDDVNWKRVLKGKSDPKIFKAPVPTPNPAPPGPPQRRGQTVYCPDCMEYHYMGDEDDEPYERRLSPPSSHTSSPPPPRRPATGNESDEESDFDTDENKPPTPIKTLKLLQLAHMEVYSTD